MALPDYQIVVVGSANMDLVVHAPRLPLPGETLIGHAFEATSGGKGANQAIAAARLGATVALIGCTGADTFGQQLRTGLLSDGVDLLHFHQMPEQPTGVASIIVGADGANSIVVAPGANASLTPQHLDDAEALIATAAILVCQLETPLETVEHAVNLAVRHRVRVILNAAPAVLLSDALLCKIDYLVINESEAALISGMAVDDLMSVKHAAEALLMRGVKQVVVTLGARGLWFGAKEVGEYMEAHSVKAVDTTAAGDTFVGGFAAGLAAGNSVRAAIALGQHAAAISVTRAGAQSSIPYRRELEI